MVSAHLVQHFFISVSLSGPFNNLTQTIVFLVTSTMLYLTTQMEGVNTKFFAGTEDGYLIYTDWKAEKDPESGKLVSSKPVYAISTHAGPVHCLLRSPFYNHIFMSVGG